MNHKKFSVSLRRLAVATAFGGLSLVPVAAQACAAEPLVGSVCTVAYATRGCPSGYVLAWGQLLPIQQYTALYALIGTAFGGDGRTNFGVPNLNGKSPVGVGSAGTTNGVTNSAVAFGQYRGAEAVTLNQLQMPAHTHTASFTAVKGPQQITIPAQPGSGAITATASTAIVPGSSGADPVANTANYYLTGVSSATANGPVTTTVPGTDKATLIGTTVAVDSSTYRPAIPQASVSVDTVTGGAVTNAIAGASQPTPTVPPQVGLYYCIATNGIFPNFD